MRFGTAAFTTVFAAFSFFALNTESVQSQQRSDISRSCLKVSFPISGRLMSQDKGSQINVREEPNSSANKIHVGYAGDSLVAAQQVKNNSDGYCWYKVKFESETQGWVRGNFVEVFMDDLPPRSQMGEPQPKPYSSPPKAGANLSRAYDVERCPAFVPRVNPWRLQEPVLLGSNARSAYYYKNVVLAGDAEMVSKFLDCYNLSFKGTPNYASAYKLWAACKEIINSKESGQHQMVCVAIDEGNQPLDARIFSEEYARKVAQKAFTP